MSAFRFGTGFSAALSAIALAATVGQAEAQQPAPATAQAPPPAAGAAQPAAKPKTKPSSGDAGAAAAASSAPAAAGQDAALKKRVEQLEEQLVDLQVVIGTLESLARAGVRQPSSAPPAAAGAGMSGSDQARLETLETQIRALTAQVEQLSREPRAEFRPPSATAGTATASIAAPAAADPKTGGAAGGAIGQWSSPGAAAATLPPVADASSQPEGARFGAGPVTSGALDPIGPQDPAGASSGASAGVGAAAGATGTQGPQVAALEPVPQNPKQLYEQAYGYLLQQNFPSAQAGFKEFLKSYPKDGLAPNALYWLGETHYVQRSYADAAEAFDLVTSAYASSIKAPDAQLKRGMSLAQLGKKQEACTVLRELPTKFPSAPVHIKQKADTERQRNACP